MLPKNVLVRKLEYLWEHCPKKRQLKITLTNGTVIRAVANHHGSWEQWGGHTEELCATVQLVERHNTWLHGGQRPS